MPLVLLGYNPATVDKEFIGELGPKLPAVVSAALDVPDNEEAHLAADDIEVWIQEASPLDVNVLDVEIIIWANEYPERAQDLERRKEEIRAFVASQVPEPLNGFVWVLLAPAAFGMLR